MNELLKKYYEERIYCEGLPKFEDLSEKEIEGLRGTFGFAFYNLGVKCEEAKKAFLKTIGVN